MVRISTSALASIVVICLLSTAAAGKPVLLSAETEKPAPNPPAPVKNTGNVYIVLLPGEKVLEQDKEKCADIEMERKFSANVWRPIICASKREDAPSKGTAGDIVLLVLGAIFYFVGVGLSFMGILAGKQMVLVKT